MKSIAQRLKNLFKNQPISVKKGVHFLKFCLMVACAIALGLTIDAYFKPRSYTVVTVDITTLSENHLKKLSKDRLSSLEAKKAIQQYAHHVERILKTLSQEHHWIIVPKEAVMQGADDVTESVQVLLEQAME